MEMKKAREEKINMKEISKKLKPGIGVIVAEFESEFESELITLKQLLDSDKIDYLVLGDSYKSQYNKNDPTNIFPIKLHVFPEDKERVIDILIKIKEDYSKNIVKICPKCSTSEWKVIYKKYLFLIIDPNDKGKYMCKNCGFIVGKK